MFTGWFLLYTVKIKISTYILVECLAGAFQCDNRIFVASSRTAVYGILNGSVSHCSRLRSNEAGRHVAARDLNILLLLRTCSTALLPLTRHGSN